MSIWQAAVLGVLQGITEFLPISSTAHLRILPAILGWEDPGAAFTAVTQLGTMAAVILYFRRDCLRLFRAFIISLHPFKPFASADSRMAWWIGLATLPIILCGLLLQDTIETSFRSLWIISGALIILAFLLLFAEKISRFTRTTESIRVTDTQIVGWAQALALIPGASRSGTTLTAAMFLGFTRESAARFSFLLSIPAVALSGLYEFYTIIDTITAESLGLLLVAIATAAITGYFTIEFLLRFLRKHSTHIFVGYRILLGITLLILLMSKTIQQ